MIALEMLLVGDLPTAVADWYLEDIVGGVLRTWLEVRDPVVEPDTPWGQIMQAGDPHWLSAGHRHHRTPRKVIAELRNPDLVHDVQLTCGHPGLAVYLVESAYDYTTVEVMADPPAAGVGAFREAVDAAAAGAAALSPVRLRTGCAAQEGDVGAWHLWDETGGGWRTPWLEERDWVPDRWRAPGYSAGRRFTDRMKAERRIERLADGLLAPYLVAEVGGVRTRDSRNLLAGFATVDRGSEEARRLHRILLVLLSAGHWYAETHLSWFETVTGPLPAAPQTVRDKYRASYADRIRVAPQDRALVRADRKLVRGDHEALPRPTDAELAAIEGWLASGADEPGPAMLQGH